MGPYILMVKSVRLAKRDDSLKLLRVIKSHIDQLAVTHPQYSVWRPAYLNRTIQVAIEASNWLVLTNNKCDGVMIASFFESPFGLGFKAQEHLIRIGSAPLKEFLDEYESWAIEHGCNQCSIGCIERTPAFERVLRPYGYTLSETVFAKRLSLIPSGG